MSIVSSSYQADGHAQVDGRTYVTETHVDNVGVSYTWVYLSDPGEDKDAILATHATILADQLAQQEIDQVINGN